MPETRQGTKTGADWSLHHKHQTAGKGKENEPPTGSPPQQRNSTSTKNKKRALDEIDGKSSTSPKSKRRVNNSKAAPVKPSTQQEQRKASQHAAVPNEPHSSSRKRPISKANTTPTSGDMTPKVRNQGDGFDTYNETSQSDKPPLTVEDLHFDYDRSQLRDPRATPGREERPYYEKLDDMPVALLERLKETRSIYKSSRPKGRLTNVVKNDMFVAEARHNPWESFYDLYQCYDKGREGSPTYDAAGFQLDYDKVCGWMKPQAYNKQEMIRGMERRVNAAQKEEEEIFALFFEEKHGPGEDDRDFVFLKDYVKDQISKDIRVPKHQIGVEQVDKWRKEGFKPVKYKAWWREPNEEEKFRMNKMTRGGGMRNEV